MMDENVFGYCYDNGAALVNMPPKALCAPTVFQSSISENWLEDFSGAENKLAPHGLCIRWSCQMLRLERPMMASGSFDLRLEREGEARIPGLLFSPITLPCPLEPFRIGKRLLGHALRIDDANLKMRSSILGIEDVSDGALKVQRADTSNPSVRRRLTRR